MCQIRSKVKIKTPERRLSKNITYCSALSFVDFENENVTDTSVSFIHKKETKIYTTDNKSLLNENFSSLIFSLSLFN